MIGEIDLQTMVNSISCDWFDDKMPSKGKNIGCTIAKMIRMLKDSMA